MHSWQTWSKYSRADITDSCQQNKNMISSGCKSFKLKSVASFRSQVNTVLNHIKSAEGQSVGAETAESHIEREQEGSGDITKDYQKPITSTAAVMEPSHSGADGWKDARIDNLVDRKWVMMQEDGTLVKVLPTKRKSNGGITKREKRKCRKQLI